MKQTLEECLELAERCGMKCYVGRPHRLLGEIALRSDPAQPLLHFDKSIEVFCGIKAANELALAYAGYGRLHKQQGNMAQAGEQLTKALGIFERPGTPIQPITARSFLPAFSLEHFA